MAPTTKKFAISIPLPVMREIDRAARDRGITRSRFIAQILARAAQARSDAEITRRLDTIFGDQRAAAEQRATARAFAGAGHPRGTEW